MRLTPLINSCCPLMHRSNVWAGCGMVQAAGAAENSREQSPQKPMPFDLHSHLFPLSCLDESRKVHAPATSPTARHPIASLTPPATGCPTSSRVARRRSRWSGRGLIMQSWKQKMGETRAHKGSRHRGDHPKHIGTMGTWDHATGRSPQFPK